VSSKGEKESRGFLGGGVTQGVFDIALKSTKKPQGKQNLPRPISYKMFHIGTKEERESGTIATFGGGGGKSTIQHGRLAAKGGGKERACKNVGSRDQGSEGKSLRERGI